MLTTHQALRRLKNRVAVVQRAPLRVALAVAGNKHEYL